MRRKRALLRWILRMALVGLFVVPGIAALAFGALVVGSEAFLGSDQLGLHQAVLLAMGDGGWLPTATAPAGVTETASTASPTPWAPQTQGTGGSFVQDPARPLSYTLTPSPTGTSSPTPTETASLTRTPSATYSPTPTATYTASPSATWTATPFLTATPSRTPSLAPSDTPVPTATMQPSATPLPSATNTPQDTATPGPSPTVDPATTVPAEPTETVPPTDMPAPSATPSGSCSTSLNVAYENEIVSLVNDERDSNGLYAYDVDTRLRAAARAHAADMACNGFTGHTGSDGSSVGDRVLAQGYSWSWIGENYMVTQNGPQTAFNWWMNSTPHTNNILSPNYTEFGVGYIYSSESDYGGYFVIVFARPG